MAVVNIFKRVSLIFMALIMFFLPMVMTYNQQIAHASIVSKPLTITAKKVAKDLAQNAAVEMAEHILFEKAINDFINSDKFKVDEGYKAVCLDGFKSVEDCPPNKRAQVKEKLTSSDKSNLSKKVEQVIEKKTNTSSKWAKFLDWFIPIFLISGLVATFDSLMDSDSEGLIDDIAMEALQETGIVKSLMHTGDAESVGYDFASVLSDVKLEIEPYQGNKTFKLSGIVTDGNEIVVNYTNDQGRFKTTFAPKSTFRLHLYVLAIWERQPNTTTPFYPRVYSAGPTIGAKQQSFPTSDGRYNFYLDFQEPYNNSNYAVNRAEKWLEFNLTPYFQTNDVNAFANNLIALINQGGTDLTTNVNALPLNAPLEVTEKGVQHLKKSDGTVTVPGIESFTYTYNNTYIYPSPDSTTGWKEKTTGEDIAIVEEDIAVDTDIDTVPEEDKEEEFPSCSKKLEKIKFNKVGTAFTNAFPFSIPWDIKRFIDASFGGVGDARPSFKLPDSLGGSRIELPAYFDSWVSFGRTIIIISFDLALVFLFYRFMRGGGD